VAAEWLDQIIMEGFYAPQPAASHLVLQMHLHGVAHLSNKTTDELLAMRKYSQDQLERYERALRTATPVLNERRQ
jgi:hypothetical protein